MMQRDDHEVGDTATALRERERELDRLSLLYAALSEINHTIFRCDNRDQIFQRVCTILVDTGGFRMAWVGWHDPSDGVLVPVAQRGDDDGYLAGNRVAIADEPDGWGPAGRAFREGCSSVSNDHLSDPAFVGWRERCISSGMLSSAGLPIRSLGEVAGTLNVYASEVEYFRDTEVDMLAGAAVDISFAIDDLAHAEERRRTEAAVLQERTFSETMIASMPGIVYLYDEQYQFLRWNRNFEETSGYSGAEIQTMHPLDFFSESEGPRVAERIADVFALGESHVEARFLSRDGTERPYFLTGRRVEFEGRTCCVGVGIDISERIEAEHALKQSENRYRTTLDSVLEGCQIVGFDWTYLYLNRAAEAQNKRPNEELLGRTMAEMWPGIEETHAYSLIRECMEQRHPVHNQTEFEFPDGTLGWFELRIQPVPEGAFLLSVDVTEQRRAERELHLLNENLEHRIVERTEELHAALVRAEEADRIKSAFLATMSHELRTPLNSIIGFTGLMLQELAGPLNAEQTKQMSMVRGSARHLLELINDVLDLSKIEAGQLEVDHLPVDVGASLDRVVATVTPMADRAGLELIVEVASDLPTIASDRRRLEQILINLVNNAIKFTEHGTITVQVEVVRAELGGAAVMRFAITDTGIGIHPADLGTLFRPFRQIDSGLGRQHEGTGLGLAICRRLATLLGGHVAATSEWSRGSTFTLTLPLETPTA